MEKAKKPEVEKNTTRPPRGIQCRYQTKYLAACPGKIFHTNQGQISQVFLRINPLYEAGDF